MASRTNGRSYMICESLWCHLTEGGSIECNVMLSENSIYPAFSVLHMVFSDVDFILCSCTYFLLVSHDDTMTSWVRWLFGFLWQCVKRGGGVRERVAKCQSVFEIILNGPLDKEGNCSDSVIAFRWNSQRV